jgi:hypothetical protein
VCDCGCRDAADDPADGTPAPGVPEACGISSCDEVLQVDFLFQG